MNDFNNFIKSFKKSIDTMKELTEVLKKYYGVDNEGYLYCNVFELFKDYNKTELYFYLKQYYVLELAEELAEGICLYDIDFGKLLLKDLKEE